MTTKNKVVKTPGWYILRAVFKNPDDARQLSDEVKSLPFPDRRWCRKIQAWAIRRTHTEFVIDIAAKYLDVKVKV